MMYQALYQVLESQHRAYIWEVFPTLQWAENHKQIEIITGNGECHREKHNRVISYGNDNIGLSLLIVCNKVSVEIASRCFQTYSNLACYDIQVFEIDLSRCAEHRTSPRQIRRYFKKKKKQVLFHSHKQFETHWDRQQKSRRYIVQGHANTVTKKPHHLVVHKIGIYFSLTEPAKVGKGPRILPCGDSTIT